MPGFIVFMYNDVVTRELANDDQRWGDYLARLKATGRFGGGSSIGQGWKFKKGSRPSPSELGIDGFMRVEAKDEEEAREVLQGNPNDEAGGTVEIRVLLEDA